MFCNFALAGWLYAEWMLINFKYNYKTNKI